ncbi:MAG TPA: DNA-binding transcriptional regulator [Treponema sp.]|nr:DNA-binding transcriptional regulator [Treponema sp.]
MRTGGEIRRNRILELLAAATEPVPGSLLASQLNVSRQVIVTDVALLRTAHPELISTSSGYMLMHASGTRRVYKVKHSDEETEDELTCIVDLGGTVLDVYVEHRVYGTIRAPLNIKSRLDVQNFMRDMRSGVSSPLKNITFGYHYHTIEARSQQVLDEIESRLRERGYLIETRDAPVIYAAKKYS